MYTKILVTGGAGFIGSMMVRDLVQIGFEVINLDALTYAGNLENLRAIEKMPNYKFVHGDICDTETVLPLMAECDLVMHLAAESHVDNSIGDSSPFMQTNVLGTHNLLMCAKEEGIDRFLHVSTDEVYGELPWEPLDQVDRTLFTEETPIDPRSPYSASKAASDLLVMAFHTTYGLDTVITRCSNNYGPRQHPEKLIPLMTINALKGKRLPVYGDGKNIRDWIHVGDHCRGLRIVAFQGKAGNIYNFGGNTERTNLDIVKSILWYARQSSDKIDFVTDRLGHDRRYAVDSSKAFSELGWEPQVPFTEGLKATIEWYKNNESWWKEESIK